MIEFLKEISEDKRLNFDGLIQLIESEKIPMTFHVFPDPYTRALGATSDDGVLLNYRAKYLPKTDLYHLILHEIGHYLRVRKKGGGGAHVARRAGAGAGCRAAACGRLGARAAGRGRGARPAGAAAAHRRGRRTHPGARGQRFLQPPHPLWHRPGHLERGEPLGQPAADPRQGAGRLRGLRDRQVLHPRGRGHSACAAAHGLRGHLCAPCRARSAG